MTDRIDIAELTEVEIVSIILACERQRDRFRELMTIDPKLVVELAGGIDVYQVIIHKLKRVLE